MTGSGYILDGTPQNFVSLALENSEKGPVLVNYWAPWAGPCLKLWAMLEKLAHEYGGKFLLVNVNTDRCQQLARERGVRSLPTLQVVLRGEVLQEVHGADSEQTLRRLIDPIVARPSDASLAEAVGLFGRGERERAFGMLEDATARDPSNPRLPLAHAKLLIRAGEYEQALLRLRRLPDPVRSTPEVNALEVHAEVLGLVRDAPTVELLEASLAGDPDNLPVRHQLAAAKLAGDDYEGAMQAFLEIFGRDPQFREGAGRRGLLATFHLLGSGHELVARFRERMYQVGR